MFSLFTIASMRDALCCDLCRWTYINFACVVRAVCGSSICTFMQLIAVVNKFAGVHTISCGSAFGGEQRILSFVCKLRSFTLYPRERLRVVYTRVRDWKIKYSDCMLQVLFTGNWTHISSVKVLKILIYSVQESHLPLQVACSESL